MKGKIKRRGGNLKPFYWCFKAYQATAIYFPISSCNAKPQINITNGAGMCFFLLMEVQDCPLEYGKQHGVLHLPCDWHTLEFWISLEMELLAKALETLTLELSGWERVIGLNSTIFLGFSSVFTLFINVLHFYRLCSPPPKNFHRGNFTKEVYYFSVC